MNIGYFVVYIYCTYAVMHVYVVYENIIFLKHFFFISELQHVGYWYITNTMKVISSNFTYIQRCVRFMVGWGGNLLNQGLQWEPLVIQTTKVKYGNKTPRNLTSYSNMHGYACPRGTNNPTLCKLMSTLYTGDIPSQPLQAQHTCQHCVSYFSYLTLLLSPWSGKHWNVRRLMMNLD